MHWIDWTIVAVFIGFLTLVALYTNRYMRSVASFLSAERCAGRYLIAVAAGMASMGAISIVAWYEMFYRIGFVAKWWEFMYFPITLLIVMSGWVAYRFRQTRAMTLAQFFEMRYSRSFRIYTGLIAFLSGIINFGIFPSVGARFFMYFCDLPTYFSVLGLNISTFAVTMIVLLSISLYFTFLGGQIAVMVTDFIQGSFFNIVSILILIYLFQNFSWEQVSQALQDAPVDQSKIHPMKTGGEEYFNVWFFLIHVFRSFYVSMGWQGSQGYFSSSKSPHESKMANVVAQWKTYVLMLVVVLIPVCAYTVMHHPDFAAQASQVNSALDKVNTDPENTVRTQMLVPIVLKTILPKGLLGAMCAVMLAAFISTHDTYMHSWGVIFIQDVIMPLRKKPFEPQQHIRVLRWSILGVTIFIFLFSLVFRHTQYILMFFAVTGAIFLGGVGSAIVGGLYWRRGSTAAAFAGMTTGAVLAVSGIIIKQIEPDFILNGQEILFFSMLISMLVYIVVSLCGRNTFDMDRLLHRGAHADADNATPLTPVQPWHRRVKEKLITKEFTRRDKLLYAVTLAWGISWFLFFVVGCIYNLLVDVPDQTWLAFWGVWVKLLFALSIAVTIWLIVGGLRDLRGLFQSLQARQIDHSDDGWVQRD